MGNMYSEGGGVENGINCLGLQNIGFLPFSAQYRVQFVSFTLLFYIQYCEC